MGNMLKNELSCKDTNIFGNTTNFLMLFYKFNIYINVFYF